MRPTHPQHSCEFGRFRIDLGERVLLRDGAVVPLTQKAFDVLLVLVERSGHIVEKEELMEKVWPDSFVEDGNLTQNIYTLRKILGQREDGQPYIQTIQRRGYRFTGQVQWSSNNSGGPTATIERATESGEEEESTSAAAPEETAATQKAARETFVGREPEIRALQSLLDQTIAGSGRIVFITGEPGQGKTFLSDEFVNQAQSAHPHIIFARGHCIEQYGSSEAYLPILEAFSALLRGASRELIRQTLRACAPTWCLQFPSAFAATEVREQLLRETAGATKERMLREMSDCLGELAAHSPVILLLEDLHWADTSTTDLLRHICHSANAKRLLLIGTYRPEDIDVSNHPLKKYKQEMEAHDQCDEIALGALNHQHIAGYLNSRFNPNDFPPSLSGLILHKTHGHPLFATRLAQYLVERGDIVMANSRWSLARELSEMDIEIPESVLSMIRRRIEALDEADRRALRHASVEGEEFLSIVVAESLEADALEHEERLDRLAKANRLIRVRGEEELPDGAIATRYAFSHALYQNVLYGDMVGQRRRELHNRVGKLLEQHYRNETSHIAAQLAMHFERGRNFARAIHYLTLVGDNSAKVYANAEAVEHYTRALELTQKLSVEEQHEARLKLHLKRGAVEAARSRFNEARDDFTRVVDGARASNALELEQAALNGLIKVLFFARQLEEVGRRTDEALALAAETKNEPLRLETLAFVVQKHIRSREWIEAVQLVEQIIADAGSINHRPALLSGLVMRGELHFQQSEYEPAEEFLTRALNLASETSDGFMHLYSLFFLGLVAGNTGRMSRALEMFNEAARIAERNGDRFWLARLPSSTGWIYRELQDFEQALEHDYRGLEIARADNLPEVEANALLNFCQEYARRNDSEKWLATFGEIEEIIARNPWMLARYRLRLQSVTAEYKFALGQFEQSEEHAGQLLELTTQYGYHKDEAVARKLLAEARGARKLTKEAEAELKRALVVLEKHQAPLVAWPVYAALGRLYLERKDKRAAREAYAAAGKIIEEIAANVYDEQLRATFLAASAVREVLDAPAREI